MMKRIFSRIIGYCLAAGCLLGLIVSPTACSHQQRYAAPPVEGNNVVIQVSSLLPEVPQFYSYRMNGKDVNFFVLRTRDRVLSFLDACLTCYPRKLGYRYEDGSVVCRACDTSYPVFKLEKGIGGCYPIRIEGRLDKGNYLIARSLLERHAGKF